MPSLLWTLSDANCLGKSLEARSEGSQATAGRLGRAKALRCNDPIGGVPFEFTSPPYISNIIRAETCDLTLLVVIKTLEPLLQTRLLHLNQRA